MIEYEKMVSLTHKLKYILYKELLEDVCTKLSAGFPQCKVILSVHVRFSCGNFTYSKCTSVIRWVFAM